MAPTVSQLITEGIIEPKSVTQLSAYKAGVLLARTEGIIPAPETNHALACVVDEARKAKEEGKEKVILFNWSGHGLLDLAAYDKYLSGDLNDYELTDEVLEENERVFADFPKPELLKSR
jgi:tryptophan synthase beta chain